MKKLLAASRSLAASPLSLTGAMLLALPLAAALLAPFLFPGDPRDPSGVPFTAPTSAFPFGTDDLGRDQLATLAHGGRASLLTGAIVTAGAALLAIAIGVFAGMAEPGLDRLLVRLMDLSQIVPRFFLALLATAWLGPGWVQLALILALTSWASLARLVRAETRALRHAPFVEAALLLGASRASVARRHLVPNMLPLALPQLPLIFASALLIEAGLCFIGAGDPNRLSWGILIQTGQANALRGWWLALFPGAMLAITCVGLTLLAIGRTQANRTEAG